MKGVCALATNGNGGRPGYRVGQAQTNTIALIVAIVWGISFLADIVTPSYQPDPKMHIVLLAVAGVPQAMQFFKGGS